MGVKVSAFRRAEFALRCIWLLAKVASPACVFPRRYSLGRASSNVYDLPIPICWQWCNAWRACRRGDEGIRMTCRHNETLSRLRELLLCSGNRQAKLRRAELCTRVSVLRLMLIRSGRGLVTVSTSKNVQHWFQSAYRKSSIPRRLPEAPEFHGYAEWLAIRALEGAPRTCTGKFTGFLVQSSSAQNAS